jgi:hypothetical protein
MKKIVVGEIKVLVYLDEQVDLENIVNSELEVPLAIEDALSEYDVFPMHVSANFIGFRDPIKADADDINTIGFLNYEVPEKTIKAQFRIDEFVSSVEIDKEINNIKESIESVFLGYPGVEQANLINIEKTNETNSQVFIDIDLVFKDAINIERLNIINDYEEDDNSIICFLIEKYESIDMIGFSKLTDINGNDLL